MLNGMFNIVKSNIVKLVLGIIIGFVLPKILSIYDYGQIKTYQLYLSYAGALALGFPDGVYLNFGGEKLNSINNKELGDIQATYMYFQLFISIIIIIWGFLCSEYIYITLGVSLLFTNLVGFYSLIYQATGEFKLYSNIEICRSTITFVANMILIVLGFKSYAYYICVYSFLTIVFCFYTFIEFRKSFGFYRGTFNKNVLSKYIKKGFLLMLGNFSLIIFIGLDKIIIKTISDIESFSYYSFASQLLVFINLLITPITVTLFNYFKTNKSDKIKIRNCLLMFVFIIITSAFPMKYIILFFLEKYMSSINSLFFLFAIQPIYAVILGIYISLYKVENRVNSYFIKLVVIIILGIGLNNLFYRIYPNVESIAEATFVTIFVWYIISEFDFKEIRTSLKSWIYIIINIMTFLTTGIFLNVFIGLLIYLLVLIITTIILMNKEFKLAYSIINSKINKQQY